MKSLILLFFFTFTANAFAGPQGQERGGGRQSELDFVEVAQLALEAIAKSQAAGKSEFAGFDTGAFSRALETTQVSARPHLCETKIDLNSGGEKTTCLDARYIPEEAKIEMSEREWPKKSCLDQAALAVHEYGRASRNENGNYKYSSRVKNSQDFWDACDLRERDVTVKCSKFLVPLEASISKVVANYQKRNTHHSDARDTFLIELDNVLRHWVKFAPLVCDNYARDAFVQGCMQAIDSAICLNFAKIRP